MTPTKKTQLALLCAASLFSLSACQTVGNILGGSGQTPDVEETGWTPMVLGDERLQADPELATTAIVLPVAQTLDSWPEAGARPSKQVGHVNAARELTVAWRSDAGTGSGRDRALTAAPIASTDTIFVFDASQTIRAFDLVTGAPRWSQEIDSGNRRDRLSIGGGFALSEGRLVVSSGYGSVMALDASNGAVIWERAMEAPMTGSPTIKDGRIFVVSNNNEVFAMSLADGSIEWTDQAISETARVLGSPSPAAIEDIVVVPYSSGEVIAYLASNGRRLWTDALSRSGRFTPISSINDIAARPVLAGGLVIAANQSGVTAAIDGRSGNRVWAQGIGSTQAPAMVGEYIFVMGTDGTLAALQAGTGRVFWATQLDEFENMDDEKGRISYSGPLVASGRLLLVSSTGDLIAFDPQTGQELARLDLGDAVYLEPIAVGERVYVLTDEARLIAIR